jgi:signal transduction histidine kinase
MKLCVYSKDPKLFELCREVVCGLSPDQYDVVVASPARHPRVTADLLVWDLDDLDWSELDWSEGDSRVPPGREAQDQLFLIGRGQVREFLQKLPLGAGSTLLKPVGTATLRIFVEQAAVRARLRQSAARSTEQDSSQLDRSDLLQCLLTANLKLQEYDQDRTNFLARAVHDFRAPLTAASGYCGLLLEQALGPLNADQIELVQRMQHSLKKLTRMASAMFQLSVGKQVERRLELKEASIETCIRHALHEIGAVAAEKKITVTLKLTSPDAGLYLDPEQIEQVLVNLLENACKFTQKGGQIEVRGYPVGGHAPHDAGPWPTEGENQNGPLRTPTAFRVDVSDTGTGILTEHLEGVFEEYTSYNGSQDRSGGGLGLAICKMIIKAHGGYVWAENHSSGARLSFVLPLSQSAGSRRRIEAQREPAAISARATS